MKLKLSRHKTFVIVILLCLYGCANLPNGASLDATTTYSEIPKETSATKDIPEQNYKFAQVEFVVTIPASTQNEQKIYLSLLDEVTGLALNKESHLMELNLERSNTNVQVYQLSLPLLVGSTIKYHYAREDGSIIVGEHTTEGEPVRYRLLQVYAPGSIEDIVSRWTDTTYTGSTGQLIGKIVDANTGIPLDNQLISIAGIQATSDTDGSFVINGLPPGIHNLVVYSKDGKYQTFQQGARIAADLPTLAPIELQPREIVEGTFTVTLPENTPPLIPVRIAGNILQLGNSFSTRWAGMSSIPSMMPILEQLQDGRYTIKLSLPAGAYIRYKYTLGDGFWNAEHTGNGEFRSRHLIVPNQNFVIEDQVDTWNSNPDKNISFDVKVPENTPQGDFISIQFNPIFGWTEPIPMWKIGEDRWGYILYSPLNLPGNFSYRYCRNGECGLLDDTTTQGFFGPGRYIDPNISPAIFQDQVEAWTDMN